MTATHSESLWTRAFVLLCIVQFLGYAQHFVLQPTMPIYVTQLGASPFVVGLVKASFAATSMVLRPLAGYGSDPWSEAGVMISGPLIQVASVHLEGHEEHEARVQDTKIPSSIFSLLRPSCPSW
jgi:MFS family permease